ncbi:MAG: efflux RND transporter periplasmic adaptor subunit [Patescibacteria group bacterium]
MKIRIKTNFKKRWKWLLLLLIVAAGLGYWVYGRANPKVEQLDFVKPERGELIKTLQASGFIKAKRNASIRFAAGGKVVYLGAKEGDWVKKGKTIATIDARALQKALEKSLNLYSKERIDWDQVLDNTKDRALPVTEDRTKQKDQFDLTNTVIDVQLNDIAITNNALVAPFDGVLVSSPTTVTGINLSATDAFELVDPTSLYFEAQVDELDVSQIQNGQGASIELDAYPDEHFDSSVQYVSYKSAQTSTSTVYLVQLPMAQLNLNKFRLGMNGDALITLQTKQNVLSVPLDAITVKDGKTYVSVKSGENQAEDKEITTGLETDERIEVLSGLDDNDEIVLPK